MRILQLTPRVADPPIDGGRVVMLQIANALRRLGNDVHVLSLNPRKQHVDAEGAIDIDTSAHLAAFLRAYQLGVPYLVARFFTPRFADALRERLREQRFDVVQVESPFLLPYVPLIREGSGAIVVLRSLNVEFRIWEQRAANKLNPLPRLIARSLRRYEIAHLNTCDAIVPITEDDARDFRALGCTKAIHVLPGGVDLPPLVREGHGAIGFLGSLDYRPNQEAALWIAEELQPRVSAGIHVAGSNAPPWLRARLGNVHFDGEVANAAEFIQSMSVMIAPIFSGGGMRIKILEAMANARPVVSTSIGAAGIEGGNIPIADDARSFAAAVSQLLSDPSSARSIGEAGRRLVESRYATDALARELVAFYEELTNRRTAAATDVNGRATAAHARP
jgi:glycosyltransferase involved in cell wall biosynthesis